MATKTGRQKALGVFYPWLMRLTKLMGRNTRRMENKNRVAPRQDLYALNLQRNDGTAVPLSEYRGKKILLVNTASDCGYTAQYNELQELYAQNKDRMVVIGFPANDFGEQEKADDATIADFCQLHFGVSFPLAKKSTVVKGTHQNPVFRWLTHKEQNGWNDHQPQWNFSKYLIDENGVLTHYFDPSISPMSEEVRSAIERS
jgi:glutathione peroxidase